MMRKALLSLAAMLAAGSAEAGTIATPSVERVAPDRVAVRWADRDPVDVFVSDRPDAAVKAAKLVSDDDRDGRHEMAVGVAERPYFLLRDSRSGELVRVAERALPLEKGSNFRDVGGYPAAGGKHVRWGLIFRSGGQPLLTDADVKAVRALGVANLVDLRSDEERVIAPTRLDGVPYSAVGYSLQSLLAGVNQSSPPQNGGATYRNFPAMLAPQLRILFAELLSGRGPVVYNCSAGQDRTGFATAMILSALGVPRDVIIADYHLSTTYRRPENEMPKISEAQAAANPVARFFAQYQGNPAAAKPQPLMDPDGKAFLAYAFEEIEARWGSVDGYLEKEVGVGRLDLVRLRAAYLE